MSQRRPNILPRNLHKKSWFIILLLIILWPLGVILVWKSNWKTRSKWLATGISAVLWSLFWVIGVLNAKPTISVNDLSTNRVKIIEGKDLSVEGKIYPYSSVLTLNNEAVSVDGSNGKFTHDIVLNEGDNSLVFKVVDRDKITTKTYVVHRMTKQEIAERDKRIADEKAKKAAEEERERVAARKAEESRKQEEAAKEAAKQAEADAKKQAEAKVKAMADKIVITSVIIKKPTDAKQNPHYLYWFELKNTTGTRFDGSIEISLTGSLDDSRGTTKSEALSVNSESAMYTGIQAFVIDSKSRPLAFGGDTQSYTYKIITGGYTFSYDSIQKLTSKSEDLSD